jgi:CheY-like chemotaxis protein
MRHPTCPPHRILVVDDELILRHLTQTLLESAGYEVLTADDGPAGLALFRGRHADIDVVLLDLALPGLHGQELLQQILALNAAAKVIIFSAFVFDGDVEWINRGACGTVAKPFRLNTLLRAIEQALAPVPA